MYRASSVPLDCMVPQLSTFVAASCFTGHTKICFRSQSIDGCVQTQDISAIGFVVSLSLTSLTVISDNTLYSLTPPSTRILNAIPRGTCVLAPGSSSRYRVSRGWPLIMCACGKLEFSSSSPLDFGVVLAPFAAFFRFLFFSVLVLFELALPRFKRVSMGGGCSGDGGRWGDSGAKSICSGLVGTTNKALCLSHTSALRLQSSSGTTPNRCVVVMRHDFKPLLVTPDFQLSVSRYMAWNPKSLSASLNQ